MLHIKVKNDIGDFFAANEQVTQKGAKYASSRTFFARIFFATGCPVILVATEPTVALDS